MGDFKHLTLVAVRGKLLTGFQVLNGSWLKIILKFWEAEQDLDNRIQVARVSEVLNTGIAGAEDGYKYLTFFKDFGKSQTKIGFKVHLGD